MQNRNYCKQIFTFISHVPLSIERDKACTEEIEYKGVAEHSYEVPNEINVSLNNFHNFTYFEEFK